jgi:hypothetical protein
MIKLKSYVQIIFLLLILTSSGNYLSAQSVIRGHVADFSTKEAIPYVNLTVTDSNFGTASLVDGSFQLVIEPSFVSGFLRVSCVGYKERLLKIDSLISLNRVVEIRLGQEVVLLNEVLVSASLPDPKDIIRDVIGKVSQNYPQSSFSTEMYSVITVPTQAGIESQYQVESIMHGYYEGYGASRRRLFNVIQKRETGIDPLKLINFGYVPSWEIQTADLLLDSRKIGVFNLDFLSDFEFKFEGITMYEGDSVFIIDYKLLRNFNKVTRIAGKEGNHHGKIFITTNSNAVVKHQFTLIHEYEVNYKKVGDKYFPYFLKGYRTGFLKIDKKNVPIIMSNEIRVTNIDLQNPRKLSEKEQVMMLNTVAFDPNYWSRHYPK